VTSGERKKESKKSAKWKKPETAVSGVLVQIRDEVQFGCSRRFD
jgi:hypothetical protein